MRKMLNKDEFMNRIKERIGEDSSDEALAFIKDMNDTYDELEAKANNDGEDWKQKYEENDKEWREKYKAAFFNPIPEQPDTSEPVEANTPKTFEELFKEKG